MPESNEENAAALQYLQQYYQSQYVALERSMEDAANHLHELSEVKATLESISLISNKNILNPISSNAYIKARTDTVDSIVVWVGGGFFVEKAPDEATLFIADSIKRQNEFISRLTKSRENLERAIMEVAGKIDDISKPEEAAAPTQRSANDSV